MAKRKLSHRANLDNKATMRCRSRRAIRKRKVKKRRFCSNAGAFAKSFGSNARNDMIELSAVGVGSNTGPH